MRMTILLATLLLACCAKPAPKIDALHVAENGQKVERDVLAEIRPGITTKAEAGQLLGQPVAKDQMADAGEFWVYDFASQPNEQRLVKKIDALLVFFDSRGVVTRLATP